MDFQAISPGSAGVAGFLPAHPGESPARLWIAAGVRRHFPVQMSQEAAR